MPMDEPDTAVELECAPMNTQSWKQMALDGSGSEIASNLDTKSKKAVNVVLTLNLLRCLPSEQTKTVYVKNGLDRARLAGVRSNG